MALVPPHYPYEYVKKLDQYACDECIRLGVPEKCKGLGHTTQSYTLYFFGPFQKTGASYDPNIIKRIRGLDLAPTVASIIDEHTDYGVIMVNERSVVGSIQWSFNDYAAFIEYVQTEEPMWIGRRLCTPMVKYLLQRLKDVMMMERVLLDIVTDNPTAAALCYLHAGEQAGATVQVGGLAVGFEKFTEPMAQAVKNGASLLYTWPNRSGSDQLPNLGALSLAPAPAPASDQLPNVGALSLAPAPAPAPAPPPPEPAAAQAATRRVAIINHALY